jgi:hypothetical protein
VTKTESELQVKKVHNPALLRRAAQGGLGTQRPLTRLVQCDQIYWRNLANGQTTQLWLIWPEIREMSGNDGSSVAAYLKTFSEKVTRANWAN